MRELERHAWELAGEADADAETVTVAALADELQRGGSTPIDVRDVRERWLEGSIPGARHAPRGMLEFWADPETEYYREFFDPDERYVLYCNEAGRSALAARRLEEMGYRDVAHLEGGFTAWKESGREIEDVPQKDYKSR